MTRPGHSELKTRLIGFLGEVPFVEIASEVSRRSGRPLTEVSALLDTFANESQVSLDLVVDHLDPNHRILEVGAGLCLFSLFLKREGYQITALEPALGGFGLFAMAKDAILNHLEGLYLRTFSEPAQCLTVSDHGSYDLIFSNNVIEHIPDWRAALAAMASLLSSQGKLVHACPNYSIPYEPHYGVPVFRRLPMLSRRMFLSAKSDPEVWDSLNFITCKDVKDFCRENDLECSFKAGLLYSALKRVDDDPLFRDRHRGVISVVASLVMRSGLGELVRRIPPSMSTPMVVEIGAKSVHGKH